MTAKHLLSEEEYNRSPGGSLQPERRPEEGDVVVRGRSDVNETDSRQSYDHDCKETLS